MTIHTIAPMQLGNGPCDICGEDAILFAHYGQCICEDCDAIQDYASEGLIEMRDNGYWRM